MLKIDIGVVFFTDIINGKEGIAYSIKNDFILVNSYEDLKDNNCRIWISNLDNDFFKEKKDVAHYLKPNDFFGVKLDIIIYQLGLLKENKRHILKNIAKIASNIFNVLDFNYNYSEILYKTENINLTKDLIDLFSLSDLKTKDNPYIKNILSKNKNFEICDTKTQNNETQIYLTFDRYLYYREICKISFPKGEWKTIKQKSIEDKDKQYFNKIAEKYHFIAECNVINIPDDIKYLFNKNYLSETILINDYEFYFISKLCDIKVFKLHICESKNHLIDIEPKKLFKVKEYEKSSLAKGICAFNYVNAFIESDTESIMSSWIRIFDRSKMLSVATIFSKMGIKILSYGNGSILISFKDGDYNRSLIKEICKKTGISYPIYLL